MGREDISVIIPAVNEAGRIGPACRAAGAGRGVDVIVVDGGSGDGTVDEAIGTGARVLQAPRQKAAQMNVGARSARGGVLCFVHADTRLPPGFRRHITNALGRPGVAAGAFSLALDSRHPGGRLVCWGANWRARLFGLAYGDQALFVKKGVFRAVGGYADLPIMEDVVLVKRLARKGRFVVADARVVTSARRWENLGYVKTTLRNVLIMAAYFLGASPHRLARWYQRERYVGSR